MMQDPEGMIGENLPTVGAILLRKRGRELPQQPYRPVIMLALVYDRRAIALRTYHHDGSLKQSSEKACHQVSIYNYPTLWQLAQGKGAMMREKPQLSFMLVMQDGLTSAASMIFIARYCLQWSSIVRTYIPGK